jgi:hypothetical protein
MSSPEKINPVKLFTGMIYADEKVLERAKNKLKEKIGKIDFESPVFPFSTPTKYYEKEMGENLKKIFFSFENLICPTFLANAKNITNDLEKKLSVDTKRKINIDAGYIDFNKVILASYKYGAQKIYIGQKVWADLTLFYSKGTFSSFPWSFPDFRDDKYYKTLFKIRELLKMNLKENQTNQE